MRLVIRMLLSLLAVVASLSAASLRGDDFSSRLANLPWDNVEVATEPGASQLAVSIHYAKPGVVADTDVFYLRMNPPAPPNDARSMAGAATVGVGKCRDGPNAWCNGAANIGDVNRHGFTCTVDLDWQKDGEKQASYRETFQCAWRATQSFSRRGFKVRVEVQFLDVRSGSGYNIYGA